MDGKSGSGPQTDSGIGTIQANDANDSGSTGGNGGGTEKTNSEGKRDDGEIERIIAGLKGKTVQEEEEWLKSNLPGMHIRI